MRYILGFLLVAASIVSAADHANGPVVTLERQRPAVERTEVDARGVRRIVVGPLKGTLVKTEFTGKEDKYTREYGRKNLISPSGRLMFGTYYDGRGRDVLIDTATGSIVAELPEVHDAEGNRVWAIGAQFSPDGKELVVTLSDGKVFLVTTAEGRITGPIQGGGRNLQFSPDGRYVATFNRDHFDQRDAEKMVLIDTQTGKAIGSYPTGGLVRGLEFADDGRTLFFQPDDSDTRVIDLPSGEQINVHKYDYDYARLTPDRKFWMKSHPSSPTQLFDARTGRLVKTMNLGGQVTRISQDGRVMVVRRDGGPAIVDYATGREIAHTSFQGYNSLSYSQISDNGKVAMLAKGYPDYAGRFFDTRSGRLMSEIKFGENSDKIEIAPSGEVALVRGYTGPARLYDLHTGEKITEFPGAYQSKYSEDGRWLSVGSNDKTVIYDTERASKVLELPVGHTAESMKFSPDNRLLALETYDQIGKTWHVIDLAGGREVPLDKSTGRVYSVDFSDDGGLVVESAQGVQRLERLTK